MPAAAAIAIIAAGTSGYQAYEASQAKSEATDIKGRNEKLAEKAANDASAQAALTKQAQDKATKDANSLDAANALRAAQQRRRNDYPTTASMKGGTILTGPMGLSAPATTATKSLLGQ